MKRIFTLILSLTLILSISFTAFATEVELEEDTTETESTETETTETYSYSLTPDGNLSLVDDVTVDEDSEETQFITVQTSDGSYFYIVIDKTSSSNNVYFLNLVDEADLYAVLNDETVTLDIIEEYAESEEIVLEPTITEKETVTETTTTNNTTNIILIVAVAVILIGAGAFYFFKFYKKDKSDSIDNFIEIDDDIEFGKENQEETTEK
ncbi:MAG: DUF4366 domain-containing protein [Clostridia bacterium]